jgi:hypothetical protein
MDAKLHGGGGGVSIPRSSNRIFLRHVETNNCHPEPPEALEREARNAAGRSKDPRVLASRKTTARTGIAIRGSFAVLRRFGFAYDASGGSG